eukprot:184885_1
MEALLQCLICFGRLRESRLCPSCSKPFCLTCINACLVRRQNCPHCRSRLVSSELVVGRFVDEFSKEFEKIKNSQSSSTSNSLLTNLYNSSSCTDVVFHIGSEKREFKAIKSVLSPQSQLLKTFFDSYTSDDTQRIEFEDMPVDAFEFVLKRMYCVPDAVCPPMGLIPDILCISMSLQIEEITKFCDTFVETSISVSNVLVLMERYSDLSPGMCRTVSDFATNRFGDLVGKHGHAGLMGIPQVCLCRVLSSDDIAVTREIQVFRFLNLWLSEDSRKDRFASGLLKHVRFPCMTVREILGEVTDADLLPTKDIVSVLRQIEFKGKVQSGYLSRERKAKSENRQNGGNNSDFEEISVVSAAVIKGHVGIELGDPRKVRLNMASLVQIKHVLALETGIPLHRQRLFRFSRRQNGTFRPNGLITMPAVKSTGIYVADIPDALWAARAENLQRSEKPCFLILKWFDPLTKQLKVVGDGLFANDSLISDVIAYCRKLVEIPGDYVLGAQEEESINLDRPLYSALLPSKTIAECNLICGDIVCVHKISIKPFPGVRV